MTPEEELEHLFDDMSGDENQESFRAKIQRGMELTDQLPAETRAEKINELIDRAAGQLRDETGLSKDSTDKIGKLSSLIFDAFSSPAMAADKLKLSAEEMSIILASVNSLKLMPGDFAALPHSDQLKVVLLIGLVAGADWKEYLRA